MEEVLVSLLEPLVFVGYVVLAAALTVGGLAMEVLGLTAGNGSLLSVPAMWRLYMGAVLLYAGYLVTRDRVLPSLRSRVADAS
jgi:hypothetical protein